MHLIRIFNTRAVKRWPSSCIAAAQNGAKGMRISLPFNKKHTPADMKIKGDIFIFECDFMIDPSSLELIACNNLFNVWRLL